MFNTKLNLSILTQKEITEMLTVNVCPVTIAGM